MGRIRVVAPSAGDAWRRRSAQPDPEAAGRPDEAACGPAAAGQRQRQWRGGLAGRPGQRRCAGGGYCRPAGACCQPGVRAAMQLEGVCRQLPGGAGGGLGASWEGACRQRAARASRCGGRSLAATGRSLRSGTAAPRCMLRAAPALPAAGGGRPARAYCHRSRASGLPRLVCLATTYDSPSAPPLAPFTRTLPAWCPQDGGYHVEVAHPELAAGLDLGSYRSNTHERLSVQSCRPAGDAQHARQAAGDAQQAEQAAGQPGQPGQAPRDAGQAGSGNEQRRLGSGRPPAYVFVYPNLMMNRQAWTVAGASWP